MKFEISKKRRHLYLILLIVMFCFCKEIQNQYPEKRVFLNDGSKKYPDKKKLSLSSFSATEMDNNHFFFNSLNSDIKLVPDSNKIAFGFNFSQCWYSFTSKSINNRIKLYWSSKDYDCITPLSFLNHRIKNMALVEGEEFAEIYLVDDTSIYVTYTSEILIDSFNKIARNSQKKYNLEIDTLFPHVFVLYDGDR